MKNIIWILLVAILACSCHEKKKLPFSGGDNGGSDEIEDTVEMDSVMEEWSFMDFSDEKVAIPIAYDDGVKYVDVTLNGAPCKMIIDSGCSGTLISIVEATYLRKNGLLEDEDIYDLEMTQIADGSVVENLVINIKKVVIGDKIMCENVRATVSSSANAPLLLGNEVLNRAPAYTIDNKKGLLIFTVK